MVAEVQGTQTVVCLRRAPVTRALPKVCGGKSGCAHHIHGFGQAALSYQQTWIAELHGKSSVTAATELYQRSLVAL